MKTERMQAVDRYLGQFLCFCASRFRRRPRRAVPPLEKILIIKMFGLGTIILMTPMVRALRKAHPHVQISFLTFSENREIVNLYGISDRIHTISKRSIWRFLADTLRAVRQLRNERLSLVIDGEFFSRYTALLSLLLKSKFRSGFFSYDVYRGNFLHHRAYFNPYRHVSKSFLELVMPFIDPEPDAHLAIPRLPGTITKGLARKVARRLEGVELDNADRPIILLNPNSSDMSANIDRSWPLENFVAFSDHCGKKGFQTVYIGGAADIQRTTAAIQASSNGARSIAGQTTLAETLAFMRKSFLLITNDSGPLHMAVSVGLPTISFYGTESPYIYGYDHGLHKFFWKRLACSPCLSVFNFKRGKCDFDSRCLRDISVAEVTDSFDTVADQLTADYQKRLRASRGTPLVQTNCAP